MPENELFPIASDDAMKMMAQGLRRSSEEQDMTQSPIFQEVLKHLGEDRTVVDIGAGVGRFTAPLAAQDCKVTALEPSVEMRRNLDQVLQEQNLTSQVRIIPESWPTPFPITAEVALASFVIQFAPDTQKFIVAMEHAASRRCVLVVHVDQMFGLIRELWPQFHGEPAPQPMLVFSDIYPQLLHMGIMANVQIAQEKHGPRFQDPAAALKMLRTRLKIQGDEPAEARLKAWLDEHRQELQRRRPMRFAIISWTPESAEA